MERLFVGAKYLIFSDTDANILRIDKIVAKLNRLYHTSAIQKAIERQVEILIDESEIYEFPSKF